MPYSAYLCPIRKHYFILVFLSALSLAAQEKKDEKPRYDRKEEIIYDNKRYRLYNNYVTLGGGMLTSSNRKDASKAIALDFNFHIRRQYFQTGLIMSGTDFNANNDFQMHLGYGLRKEKAKSNLAAYAGLTYFFGVETITDTSGIIPRYYDGVGIYASGQITTKLTYDIGVGFEMFGEYSPRRSMAGFKVFLFFSGAYRGPKRNYNPHVRSENQQ